MRPAQHRQLMAGGTGSRDLAGSGGSLRGGNAVGEGGWPRRTMVAAGAILCGPCASSAAAGRRPVLLPDRPATSLGTSWKRLPRLRT